MTELDFDTTPPKYAPAYRLLIDGCRALCGNSNVWLTAVEMSGPPTGPHWFPAHQPWRWADSDNPPPEVDRLPDGTSYRVGARCRLSLHCADCGESFYAHGWSPLV